MSEDLAEIEDTLLSVAADAAASLQAQFESLKAAGSRKVRSKALGFALNGELGPDGGPHPMAYNKYAFFPHEHIRRLYPYLPYLMELKGKTVFEIGVGAGYLFTLLKKLYSANMVGIDVGIDEMLVFRELRRRLGIEGAVFEHRVEAGKDIPIPKGAEAVLSFWPVYNSTWTLEDHEWFLDHCSSKLSGRRVVVFRFNRGGHRNTPDIRKFYEARAIFPLGRERDFCLINL